MDEDQNNNGQDIVENTNDNNQDTKNAIKDGANLAKNVTTANALGAIKSGVNLLKNKKARRIILISILIPVIVIVSLASVLYIGFTSIAEKIKEKVGETVDGIFAKDEWARSGVININNDVIDSIIEAIESTGIDLEDLKLLGDVDYNAIDKESEEYKEALRKYIRKFYEAQVVTETLNTNPNFFQELRKNIWFSICI